MAENGSLDEAAFLESLTRINLETAHVDSSSQRRRLPDRLPPTGHARPPDPRLGAEQGPNLSSHQRVADEHGRPHDSDSAGYEAFYGFSDQPFGPAPDLRFLYHSAAHDAASEALLSAVTRRDAVTVLTAPAGAGKTLLASAVIDQLDRRTMTSVIRDPSLTLDDLLERVLVDFGVMKRDESRATGGRHDALTTALQSFSASLAPLQAAAVIVIDDAHRLAPDVIEHLDILTSGGGGPMVLILMGEPLLLKQLNRPALRALDERVAARVALGPLAADEMQGYVTHRLRAAGDSARVEFDDGAVAAVYALSGGLPRIVNEICDAALTRGARASAGVIDPAIVEQAARDLGLARPPARGALVTTLIVYLSLMLIGAAAAAWLFWDRVLEILRRFGM